MSNWNVPPANHPDWEPVKGEPIDVSATSSTTFSVSQDYDYIKIVSDKSNTGFDSLQVNGDTAGNYDYIEEDGTTTGGASYFPIGRAHRRDEVVISADASSIHAHAERPNGFAARFVGGSNANVSSPISQFTLFDNSGNNRTCYARVYGFNL